MSHPKSAHRIVSERLAHWYLFKPRSFVITLDQLAELLDELEKPTRLGWGVGSKKEKISELLAHLAELTEAKEKTNEGL